MAAKQIPPRTLVLAAVTIAAAVVLVTIWPRAAADNPGSSPGGAPANVRPQDDPAVPPALGLERMEQPRATPEIRRDLFRMGAAIPDPADNQDPGGQTPQRTPGGRRGAVAPPPVDLPPVETAPPPIPLSFVGLARRQDGVLVASLSDGQHVFTAREGDVVEGRWRVVKIGVESLVIERIDGTGRQTLRLR